uniref:Uncharacterized protein n=1 Tax=Anguilla anguilla TaxID=7936 RepID=A0A0E9PEL0_ANGAN
MSEGRGSWDRKGVGHFWTPHFPSVGHWGTRAAG